MSPGEKLDPLPDPFILQPPVFHPVTGGTGSGVWTRGGPLPRPALSGLLQGALGPCWARVRLTAGGAAALAPQILAGKGKSGQWGQGQGSWNLDLQAQLELSVCPSFQVSVNGQHFLHYRYRLPLSRVDTLGIFGDILVKAIGFLNINPFAEGGSEYPVGYVSLRGARLELPCSRALPRGLWPGQVIVLRGLVLPEPKDFTLSLRDEAAHVPVTLRASFADRTLAWISPWGCKKLISAPFLFYPKRFFEVLLLCQEGGLKLALNGQGLGATSLRQRTLERLRELRISGSVQLYCVHY
uniref:Galectin n=1 Tax=Ailuropoda melanoleuca TaxID=9646 RepID=A0A7N5KBP2_AILME